MRPAALRSAAAAPSREPMSPTARARSVWVGMVSTMLAHITAVISVLVVIILDECTPSPRLDQRLPADKVQARVNRFVAVYETALKLPPTLAARRSFGHGADPHT